MSLTRSTTAVRPSSARSTAIRATAGPHIIPWPQALAIVAPSTSAPSRRTNGTEQRQMVGRVFDRRRPHFLRAEALRGRQQRVESSFHLPQVGPVDRATGARLLGGVRHAPQDASLLGAPVDAGADVEGHRGRLGVQVGGRLGDDHLMTGVADPGTRLGGLGDRLHRGTAGEDHGVGRDGAGGRVDAGDDAATAASGARAQPEERHALAELDAAACIASEYARTFRGGSTQPSVAT